MAIVNSRAAIEPKTGKAAIFVNETIHSLMRKLFSNGEQGFFYDTNDLSTMFQDGVGTVPVTDVGQPVGLMLDKSKALALGNELVINGDFANGKTAWNDFTGVSTVSNGTLTLTNPTAPPTGYASQSLLVTIGKAYRISAEVINGSISALTGSGTLYGSTTSSMVFVATSSTLQLRLLGVSNGVSAFKNVSVKEVAGNHAYQTTSASRPILQRNATTGAYYLEFDGVDDFFTTSSIDFTATDEVSLFSCSRNLSTAEFQTLVELGDNPSTGTFLLRCPQSASRPNYLSRGTATAEFRSTYSSGVLSGTVLSCVSKISTDTLRIRFNGFENSSNADQGTGNYGNYPLYIGMRGGTSNQFRGRIYGLIGVGKLTSGTEVIAIEKEFAKRVGVTLNV